MIEPPAMFTYNGKQTRPGGIDKLPADFKPRFNFVLSESASGMRRAAEGKGGWLRPKPFETVNVLGTNRCVAAGD